ncbi:CLUMA_CG000591, isoform A [Clunio marinus]|uniref:CLUMA_CG000591, isoform A n=1 Tax=Clunio marinus TaxID=568069 RepID=A0A1J1HFL2_9DIPT|nr:CLUMA_CG000591, isoform A [Clunio marinus]
MQKKSLTHQTNIFSVHRHFLRSNRRESHGNLKPKYLSEKLFFWLFQRLKVYRHSQNFCSTTREGIVRFSDTEKEESQPILLNYGLVFKRIVEEGKV